MQQQQLVGARVGFALVFAQIKQIFWRPGCGNCLTASCRSLPAAKLTPSGGPVSSGSAAQTDAKKSCNRSEQPPARKSAAAWEQRNHLCLQMVCDELWILMAPGNLSY